MANPIELLAPAKNLECGKLAILGGADAVYIGASKFGAREDAGNPPDDIAALVQFAHPFHARVYVTVNTLLRDGEVPQAVKLIHELDRVGVDAVIIQDLGLLQCELPAIPLFASTQTHNFTPEKLLFLERVGFQRAILARELSLAEIRRIRERVPGIELEALIFGALCVCHSGRCALSQALGGRSGNRGECAQPCRKVYSILDGRGPVDFPGRFPLSLRDLDLASRVGDLIDAGVTSFKIEGRLKGPEYVANAVAHCRRHLDAALAKRGLRRSSSGHSNPGFHPDPGKTFNRGFTRYFFDGRKEPVGSPRTPTMLGEPLGRVKAARGKWIELENPALTPAQGDGLCFFGRDGLLHGTLVTRRGTGAFAPEKITGLGRGTEVFRNQDRAFLETIRQAKPSRKIRLEFLRLSVGPGGFHLLARDEDGIEAAILTPLPVEAAEKPDLAEQTIREQLLKSGDSNFEIAEVRLELTPIPFLAHSTLNRLRRQLFEAQTLAREKARPRPRRIFSQGESRVPYPVPELEFQDNVLNRKAAELYTRHGVTAIEPAAESGLDLVGRRVMTTRYCLRHQLGQCQGSQGHRPRSFRPLFLRDEQGTHLRAEFHCDRCEMEIWLEKRGGVN